MVRCANTTLGEGIGNRGSRRGFIGGRGYIERGRLWNGSTTEIQYHNCGIEDVLGVRATNTTYT